MSKLSETGTSYFGPNILYAKPVVMTEEELRVYRYKKSFEND